MFKKIVLLFIAFFIVAFAASADSGASVQQIDNESLYQEFALLKEDVEGFKVIVAELMSDIRAKQAEFAGLLISIEAARAELEYTMREIDRLKVAKIELEKSLVVGQVVSYNTNSTNKQEQLFVINDSDFTLDVKSETAVEQETFVVTGQQIAAITTSIATPLPEPVYEGKTDFSLTDDGLKEVVVDTIYFNPDSTMLNEQYIPNLEAIAGQLQESPDMSVTIRGYSAPAGTKAGQVAVSKKRAENSADYIANAYGIDRSRLIVEWVGAAQTPSDMLQSKSMSKSDMTSRRAVEFIITS